MAHFRPASLRACSYPCIYEYMCVYTVHAQFVVASKALPPLLLLAHEHQLCGPALPPLAHRDQPSGQAQSPSSSAQLSSGSFSLVLCSRAHHVEPPPPRMHVPLAWRYTPTLAGPTVSHCSKGIRDCPFVFVARSIPSVLEPFPSSSLCTRRLGPLP
jgi:hypothetical protein